MGSPESILRVPEGNKRPLGSVTEIEKVCTSEKPRGNQWITHIAQLCGCIGQIKKDWRQKNANPYNLPLILIRIAHVSGIAIGKM